MIEQNQRNKQLVFEHWKALEGAQTGVEAVASKAMADDVIWHCHEPVGEFQGIEGFASQLWSPLLHSIPDLRRNTHLFFGGASNGRIDGDVSLDGHMWVTGTGTMDGTFVNDYLSIPATGKLVSIRWGDFSRIEDGQIVEVFFLVDLVDLAQQAGVDLLPPSRGIEFLYPPPKGRDGILLDAHPVSESAFSLDHIRRFIFEGLNSFDETDLESMGMAEWFHPEVHWYGPGGIGACLSFDEFETRHQAPWLVAFPDRAVQDLDALIAEGAYSGAPGWAGVKATHTGPYLDQPATGRSIDFNGLDWWKREGERYVENWVFVDMVHLFDQMGVDLFARM